METKDGRDTADQTVENWQNTKNRLMFRILKKFSKATD